MSFTSHWVTFHHLTGQLSWYTSHLLSNVIDGEPPFWQLKCLLLLMLCHTLHALYLTLVPLPPFVRLLHSDVALYFACPQEMNLLTFGLALELLYTMFNLTFTNFEAANYQKLAPILLVWQILFGKKSNFFFCKTVNIKGSKRIPTIQLIKAYLRYYQFVLQYLILNEGLILLYFQAMAVYLFWGMFPQFAAFYFAPVLLGLCLLIKIDLFLLTFATVNSLMSELLFTATAILFEQFNQLHVYLGSLKAKATTEQAIYRFTHYHTRAFTLVLACNALFGTQLLVLLVIFLPCNTFLVMGILLGQYPPIISFIFANMALAIYLVLFFFHLLASMYSKRIHRCSTTLLSLYSQQGRNSRRSLRSSLTLHHYILKFHCCQKYGLTYGALGLMTSFSFAQFILLYSEFLMYWSKFYLIKE